MKRVLAHLDDVGASRGSVEAWAALRRAGVVRSASTMVPCPWYPAARDQWREDPGQDLGVHITLTSEWSAYRWRPMIGPLGGLTDDEGFFHRRPEMVQAAADPGAVADEIAAQIERVLADGIRPTHLDAHMGTAFCRPFLPKLIEAARRYAIPLLATRDLGDLIRDLGTGPADMGYPREVIEELEAQGWPVLDRFLIAFCPDDREAADHYRDLIAAAPEGSHFLALHANAPDDGPAFAPHHVAPRRKEYELFSDPASRAVFGAAQVITFADLAA